MQHRVTTTTRYPASLELIAEMVLIHGSNNKASKALGIPWATWAMVSNGSKPLPIAAAVKIAQILARDPLLTLAQVEAEHTKGWIQDVWLTICRER